jgi:hypothetical protein
VRALDEAKNSMPLAPPSPRLPRAAAAARRTAGAERFALCAAYGLPFCGCGG